MRVSSSTSARSGRRPVQRVRRLPGQAGSRRRCARHRPEDFVVRAARARRIWGRLRFAGAHGLAGSADCRGRPRQAQHVGHSQGISPAGRAAMDRAARQAAVSCARKASINIVRVTDEGRRLLAGELTPTLLVPAKAGRAAAAAADRFVGRRRPRTVRCAAAVAARRSDQPRQCRRTSCSATRRCATWRGGGRRRSSGCWTCMASASRRRPTSAQQFVECIVGYCSQHGLTMDVAAGHSVASGRQRRRRRRRRPRCKSFPLFDEGLSVEEVARAARPRDVDDVRLSRSVHPASHAWSIRCRGSRRASSKQIAAAVAAERVRSG